MAANKFKMSNGSEGMLRGQGAPKDAFQRADPSMPARNKCYDTDFERMAVKPQKTHAGSTGFTSQCAELATDGVMEQAIQAKLNESMKAGITDGYNARMEEEANKPVELTDAQIDEIEDRKKEEYDDIEVLRARRRQQMKDAHDKKMKYEGLGHGQYDEIEEEAFLKTVTNSERCVVHFYHNMFEKCKVMDMHMRKCSLKFMGTRFVKLNAEKAPFFVEKLKIKTLPCAIAFNDGVAVSRQIGFDGLTNGGDDFKTILLAWRFKEAGVIEEDFGPEDENMFD